MSLFFLKWWWRARERKIALFTLLRTHCFQECFLGAQTSEKQCFLAEPTKKHFTENNSLYILNSRSAASPRRWNPVNIVPSARKWRNICYGNKMFLKKSETFFVSERMFRLRANGKTFRETYCCKNVSATMFPRFTFQCLHDCCQSYVIFNGTATTIFSATMLRKKFMSGFMDAPQGVHNS